jgi:anti-sigma factor (TIGR02949 family)
MTNESDKHDVIDTDCLEAFVHLYAYLNGELHDKPTLAKIEHHLGHCKSCFSRAQMERELNERLKKTGKSTAPEALQKRLRELIKDF